MVAYRPYSLVDVRLSWDSAFRRGPSYNVYVEVNNLLDYKYFDYGNVPQPGIMAKAGIIVNVGLR